MPSRSRKRSRPKAGIEPIHVGELLDGAGMRGFLSVLEAPRHSAPVRRFSGDLADGGLLNRFSARVAKMLVRFDQQDEALRAVTEIARRIKRGVITLQGQSEAIWVGRRLKQRGARR